MLKDACAKWEKELAVFSKWALENDGVLSAAEKQLIEVRKSDIEAIKARIAKIEATKELSPQVLVDKDGNIIYTPTNKIEARPFEWKEENDGSWKRKVHLAKELYYYTNKGRKLYAYEVIEIYFEIAPNDENTGKPDSEKISELKNSRRAATEDEKWNCHGNTFINGKIGLTMILV